MHLSIRSTAQFDAVSSSCHVMTNLVWVVVSVGFSLSPRKRGFSTFGYTLYARKPPLNITKSINGA